MEIATNTNWEESWCRNYNKIVNNYGAVMTRSKYRSLQQEVGCPLGALLLSLPTRKRHTGASENESQVGRRVERQDKRCNGWRRRLRRRRLRVRPNRRGFVDKRWKKRAEGCLRECLLKGMELQEESSRRRNVLPSIEIPDPTPSFAINPLVSPSSSAADAFNASHFLFNTCPALVPEPPPPFVMNSWQNLIHTPGPMTMQPSSVEKCAETTHHMGIFRMPEPTWQQWNGSPEISAKKTTPHATQFIGKNFENCNMAGEISSRGEGLYVNVFNNTPGTDTSPGTSTKNPSGEAQVSQQSLGADHQGAHIDVETPDDEVNTRWSMENTRGSAVSDPQEEMDVDVEGMENDPSMTVPDEWCDACRQRLAPTTEIMSLSRRYRVAKWIGSLLGFMGLVSIEDARRTPMQLLEMHSVQAAGASSTASSPGHRSMFS